MPTRKELIDQVRADQRARSSQTRADNPKSAIVGIGDRDPLTGLHEVLLPDGSVEMGEKQFNSSLPKGSQVLGIPESTGGWLLDERDVQPIKPPIKPSPMGNIKVLFSTIEGYERVFYVGGDRATPKKIYTISKDAIVFTASLNNAGDGDLYFVGLSWAMTGVSLDNAHKIGVSNQKTWEITTPLASLNYYGFDFWTQVPLQVFLSTPLFYSDYIVAYGTEVGIDSLVSSNTSFQTIPYIPSDPIIYSNGAFNTRTTTFFPSALSFAMSGSGTLAETNNYGPFEPNPGYRIGGTQTVTKSGSYNFNAEISSLYKGSETKTTGSNISWQSSGSGTVEHSLAFGPTYGEVEGNASLGESFSQFVKIQLSPKVAKSSASSYQIAATESGNAYDVGPLSRADGYWFTYYSSNVSQIQDSQIPVLAGQQGQSLYKHSGYTATYAVSDGSPSLKAGSLNFTRPVFKDYYLATSQSEIKLGGELPKKASDPTIVEFRVSDNLIKSKYHRVQLDSSIFGKPIKPDVDVHSLSANSTKKTIKAKIYGIPKPSSGMPTDAAGLAALTSQLRQGQPVTIGNVTIYNASYHP